MPDLDILRELIRDDTLVVAANDLHGRDVLVLEETSPDYSWRPRLGHRKA